MTVVSSRPDAPKGDTAALAEGFIEQRARIKEENAAAPRGRATCHALADLTDGVIRTLFRRALPSRGPRTRSQLWVRRQLAVVATGGYGRRELCPYSDIDVTFIVAEEEEPLLDAAVRQLFLTLMEVFAQRAQLKVGYAYRTVQDCEQLDHQTQTALLDTRLLAGSPDLLIRFRSELERSMWPGAFVRQKLAERAAVAAKHGDSIYLVEPQIREGHGGLRDLHVAEWLARVAFEGGEWDPWRRLLRAGAISREEATAASAAREFYLALRNWMHFETGRPADLLTRDRQEALAAALGYRDEPPVAAVEQLMRDVYSHAERVRRTYRQVEARTLRRRLRLDPELDCAGHEVSPADPRADVRRPQFLMTLCRHYQEHGLVPAPELTSRVTEAMDAETDLRADTEAGQLFMQLLGGSRSVSATLELMVSLGLIQRLIPELGEAFRRVPLEAIHKHTIGFHSLLAAEELDALRGMPPEQGGDFRRVFDVIDSPQLLFLATLLHDLGKIAPGSDHSTAGAEMAREICRRLGLDTDAAERVSRLVQHHLLMSRTSQLRDLTLPQTIRDFIAVIDSPDLLSMLFLLTYADMKATGVLSPVRVRFLEDLFYRAEQALNEPGTRAEGGPQALDPERLRRYRTRLSRQLSDHRLSEEEIRRHCEGMPVSYLLNTAPDQIAAHVRMVETLRAAGPVVEFPGDLGPEISVMTVCTYDDPQPGLLSRIAGVLYAHEVGIHAAQVFTREGAGELPPQGGRIDREAGSGGGRAPGAVALDTLWVDFHGRALPPLKKMELETDLTAVLRGQPVDEVLAAHRKHLPPGLPPERVRFDNDLAEHHTVVEIDAPDQPGLLYRLTRATARLGWDIHSARISTTGDRARDAFYITDRAGAKITGDPTPLQRAFIEAALAA
jgi:[protein-PII] uridylyltransferase